MKRISYPCSCFIFVILMICVFLAAGIVSAQKSDFDGTVFAVYSDSSRHDTEGEAVHNKIVSNILTHNPDFVLYIGDMVNNPLSKEGWESHLRITKPIQDILYPSPGDNEEPKNDKESWSVYHEVYSKFYNSSDYYSFNKGDIYVVSLDSNIDFSPGSEQYTWLANDLEENKDFKWKFVFFHHPPYIHEYYQLKGDQKSLVQLFEKYGVDIVFNSDYHLYARSFPVYEDKINTAKGITYIVTGGGGSGLTNAFRYNFLFPKSIKAYHFIEIAVNDDILELSVYGLDNKKLDEHKIIKGEEIKISFKERIISFLKHYLFNEKIRTPIRQVIDLV